MKNKKVFIILAAVLGVILIAAAILYPRLSEIALSGDPAGSSVAENGTVTLPGDGSDAITAADNSKAADFTVYDASGKAVRLSDFLGQPVIVNFWASWCPPCKEELPYFNAAYEAYGDRIVFLMVDLADGYQETHSSAEALVKEKGYTFPVYFDLSGSASEAYSLYSIPQTVAVDAAGNIVFSQIGSLPETTVEQIVTQFLG